MTEFDRLFSQIDEWCSRPPEVYAEVESEMRETCAAHPEWSEFEQKSYGYTVIADTLEVAVFPACPFSFAIMSHNTRGDLSFSGLPSWYKRLPAARDLYSAWRGDMNPFSRSQSVLAYQPVDDVHHTLDYDTILKKGLFGILDDIEAREQSAEAEQLVFLKSMKTGIRALERFCQRFHRQALRVAQECEGADKENMLALANAIENTPMNPARTFHEALNVIVFMYFAVPSLDANNVSVFGHIDRLLYPYLQNDLKNGTITTDKAYDLLWRFLAIQDARFGKGFAGVGSNSTVMLGGCDAAGAPVYNEISSMVLRAVAEFSLVDPKINIRISKNTDNQFLHEIAVAQSKQVNNIAIFNDDVIIPANVAVGKAVEDARLYVGGGCLENIIGHCEINNRATVYLNNCAPLVAGFYPDRYRELLGREGQRVYEYDGCDTFDKFYAAVMNNTRAFNLALINVVTRYEKKPLAWCASPLHSAFLGDCIENARDMFLGGTRYKYDSVSQSGIGTVIDGLLAVKTLVYDEEELSLADFALAMEQDYAGHETLRSRLLNRMPKFGHETPEAREMAKTVFADIAKLTHGIPNGRGGVYEASLYSFRINEYLGRHFGATPDGRKAGELFSPGMSPSLYTPANVTQIFNVMSDLDLTAYQVVSVLDMKLPPTQPEVLCVVYKQFVNCGGSAMQLNIVSQGDLEDALIHPEKYPNLVVRICGYSVHFVDLSPAEREEVVARVVNL